jgi:hypothetical protein
LEELAGQVISARLASPACARAPALSTGPSHCQASIVRGLQIGRPAVAVGAVLMAVVLFAAALVAAVARRAADRPADGSSLDVQAHRGGLGLRPESSLAAFTNAL